MQPDADREDQPERPERAREQFRKVIARHVLDHLAAGARDRAVAERDGDADHEVARGPVAMAQGPAVTGGEHASDRRGVSGAERRIEREHLVGQGERPLGLVEGDTRLEHGRQVSGVVLDNPVQRGGAQLEVGSPPGKAPLELCPATADPHRPAVGGRGGERRRRMLEGQREQLVGDRHR